MFLVKWSHMLSNADVNLFFSWHNYLCMWMWENVRPRLHTIAGLGRGPSHGQIAGPMLGSAPHFCAFTHENSATAEPRYFVQCDSFRHAWHCTCKQTLHVNNVYGLAFGPACVYTQTGHGSATATTSEAGPKSGLAFGRAFWVLCIYTQTGPRPTAVCKRGLSVCGCLCVCLHRYFYESLDTHDVCVCVCVCKCLCVWVCVCVFVSVTYVCMCGM